MHGMTGQDKKWRAESDVLTLIEYQEIHMDKPRYKLAMECAKKQKKALDTVAGVKPAMKKKPTRKTHTY